MARVSLQSWPTFPVRFSRVLHSSHMFVKFSCSPSRCRVPAVLAGVLSIKGSDQRLPTALGSTPARRLFFWRPFFVLSDVRREFERSADHPPRVFDYVYPAPALSNQRHTCSATPLALSGKRHGAHTQALATARSLNDRLSQVHAFGSVSLLRSPALSDARDLALVCELRLDLLVELELVLLDLHLGVVRGLARLHPPAVSSTAVVGTSVSN